MHINYIIIFFLVWFLRRRDYYKTQNVLSDSIKTLSIFRSKQENSQFLNIMPPQHGNRTQLLARISAALSALFQIFPPECECGKLTLSPEECGTRQRRAAFWSPLEMLSAETPPPAPLCVARLHAGAPFWRRVHAAATPPRLARRPRKKPQPRRRDGWVARRGQGAAGVDGQPTRESAQSPKAAA